MRLTEWQEKSHYGRHLLYVLASLTPLVATGYMVLLTAQPQRLKTEKQLVAYAVRHMQPGEKLAFLGSTPFSTTFYSRGQARSIANEDLADKASRTTTLYLAVPKDEFDQVSKHLNAPLSKIFESRQYILTVIP